MKWISIDIGIKNMAYCILTLENNELHVVDWNVINLIETVKPVARTCGCILPKKKGKLVAEKACLKKAVYEKNGDTFCESHGKTHSEYHIPTSEHTLAFLRKQKVADIIQRYGDCFPDSPIRTKSEMMDELFGHYNLRNFTVLPKVAKPNASQTDLVSIGWAIKREFDKLEHANGVMHVVIENQISPIATRMKTIQGMVAQYFIMKSESTLEPTIIHFVSSSNKLKSMEAVEICRRDDQREDRRKIEICRRDDQMEDRRKILPSSEASAKPKSSYSKNKKDGILLCSRYLATHLSLSKWKDVLHTTKKDDLADCFLQGIWFMEHHKLRNEIK